MRARSWAEQQAIKRWYDARGGGQGRAPHKFMAISEAMSGADELDNTRELDAILEEANRPTLHPYDPAGLISK